MFTHAHTFQPYLRPLLHFSHQPLPPADNISVSCGGNCLLPLCPYRRNNVVEFSDTVALSTAWYTKADTMPHISAQTRNTAHSAPANQRTRTMPPPGDLLMIVSNLGVLFVCVTACRCVCGRTRHLTLGSKL